MIVWAVAGLMVAVSLALIARTLLRAPAAGDTPHPDLAVYRAQLTEVERDAGRGLIAAADAQGLRSEIARRILDLDRRTKTPVGAAAEGGIALPLAVTAGVLIAAVALYGRLGAPDYPAVPHAARIAAAEKLRADRPSQAEAEARTPAAPLTPEPAFADLMEKLRASTVAFPEKIEGFRLLAQYEAQLRNYAAAARAKSRVIELSGAAATAQDHAEQADLLVRAAGGIVTAEAEAELAAALRLDPALGTARFYAGLLEAQTGRPDRAFAFWRPLYEESPPEAPWMTFLGDQIGLVAAAAGVNYTAPAPKGPGAADVAAAAQMNPKDRAAMIEGMVAGLEARLMGEGGSPEDWVQLLNALAVLGAKDRAAAAWARAERVFAQDPAALGAVRTAARSAGAAE